MSTNANSSDSIRSILRKLEDRITHARSERTCTSDPDPMIPTWAQPTGTSSGEAPIRQKAQRKSPTGFAQPMQTRNAWTRKAS